MNQPAHLTRSAALGRRLSSVRFLTAISLTASLLGASACGSSNSLSGAFNTQWQDDGGKSITNLRRETQAQKLPVGVALAVGVTASGLSAVTLDGKAWHYNGSVDSRPTITGDVVVATGGGQLFALDGTTGKRLWSVSAGDRLLRGAGDDGQYTVASLGALNGGRSRLVVVERGGAVVLDAEPEPEIGTPAVLGGIAFIPWGNQYVSAVDVKTGAERGRLLMRQQVSRAVNIGGQLYFGETQLVQFDDKIGQASADGATVAIIPKREMPGKPRWFAPGAEIEAPSAAAPDRIRFYARPSATGQFEGDRIAATYFRVAMGISGTDAQLRWVRLVDSDILGGAHAASGFAFCTAKGEVLLLDGKTGAQAAKLTLGEPVKSCEVQGGAFVVPSKDPELTLPEQLGKVITTKDPQMVIAQRFLLGELGTMKDDVVTKVLIDLASNTDTPPMLFTDARKLLAARRSGVDYMLTALEREYDFLDDVLLPPPVGPLADALGAMNEPRAAQPLAAHLNDPSDTPDDIMRAAKALETLATAGEFEQLKIFFALYRATASDDAIVSAVISVAKAMLRVGGKEGEALVADATRDPLTNTEVQLGLQQLKPPAPKAAAAKDPSPAQPSAGPASAAPAAAAPAAAPVPAAAAVPAAGAK